MLDLTRIPKMCEDEEWTPYYEASAYYAISSEGRVYSAFKGGFIMKPRVKPNGYLYVGLRANSGDKPFNRYVHRMTALTYIPNPHNYPVVMHDDDIRANCAKRNLAWGTQADNIRDMHAKGRANVNNSWGGDITVTQIDSGLTWVFTNYKELTETLPVKRQSVYCAIRDGRIHKGYRFERV